MNLMIDNRQDKFKVGGIEEIIKTVTGKAIEFEGSDSNCQVSIILVDNIQIRELNRLYRKIDRATDVLSFPLVDYEYESGTDDNIDMDTGETVLGDIAISLEKANEQSIEYGHSFEREISFLTVHGVLHLLGYDHETEEERQEMRDKEEKILNILGITR